MRKIQSSIVFISVILTMFKSIGQHKKNPIEGRWNITIDHNGNPASSWLEIKPWGFTKVGRFLHTGGYPRPLSTINVENNNFEFSVPWNSENRKLKVRGTLKGRHLNGTIYYPDGKSYSWTADRAPELAYESSPTWDAPINLFNGQNLEGWHTTGPNQWVAKNGVLMSPKPGSNLISDAKFMNFKLHIEFRYPEHGNSGVYLRGRYEVQIDDSKGKGTDYDVLGSIFGFLEPTQVVAKKPGSWQTFNITLIGRRVTVEANGIVIIDNQRIPGITGGALDSEEAEPGPFVLQGDHHPIEFRNIIVMPMKFKN